MMDMRTEGVEQALRRMRKLPEKVQRRHVKKALRKAAKPILKESRRHLPRPTAQRPGLPKAVINTKISRSRRPGQAAIVIGPNRKNIHWRLVHLFEHGTQQRFTKSGVDRGRMKAYGMLRKGFDARVGEAERVLARELGNAIETEARK